MLPNEAIALTHKRISDTLSNLKSLTPQQIESSLKLLDLFGEANSKDLTEKLKGMSSMRSTLRL